MISTYSFFKALMAVLSNVPVKKAQDPKALKEKHFV